VFHARQLPPKTLSLFTPRQAIVPRGFFIPKIKQDQKIILFGEDY